MKKYVLKKISKEIKKDYKIDYEDKLNNAQREAVTRQKGPMLVIAGAGSGKTRTLVYRAIRFIEDGINPENILLLTFTRKAAGYFCPFSISDFIRADTFPASGFSTHIAGPFAYTSSSGVRVPLSKVLAFLFCHFSPPSYYL